jgi:predicted transcriptional regulator
MCYMPSETLTVRIDPEMKKQLDAIAASQDRDRAYVVREALTAYLELHQWQVKHIEKGVQAAHAGRFASEAEVRKTIARLTRR